MCVCACMRERKEETIERRDEFRESLPCNTTVSSSCYVQVVNEFVFFFFAGDKQRRSRCKIHGAID